MTAKRQQPQQGQEHIDGVAILRAQLSSALTALTEKPKLSDTAIHSARKELKRARATLRLLRDSLGKRTYARDNAAIRDAARPLSSARDAKVMADTFKNLTPTRPPASRSRTLHQLKAALGKERRRSSPLQLQRSSDFSEVVAALRAALRRAAEYHVADPGRKTIESGTKRIYRHGRRALSKADAKRDDEKLHELRKHVKYFVQAMKTIAPAAPADLAKSIERAQSIADDLGDDHDLAMLQQKIAALAPPATQTKKALSSKLESRRRRLQKRALTGARELFRRKRPPAFDD